MPLTDFWIVLRWWGVLFFIGAAAFPLTKLLFSDWYDQGYIFSKAIGMAVVGWLVLVFGMARIAPFTNVSIGIAIGVMFIIGVVSLRLLKSHRLPRWNVMIIEELFFFFALLFWSWVKAHEPSIRGLEKFMDYGFMNSILHSRYFPSPDMWYPPKSINYYYFGHLVTAFLTKLSGIDLAYTFNLMLASIFAWTFTMSFSIGYQISVSKRSKFVSGLLTAFLVALAGNMQTIYAFTRGYAGDNVQPFWKLGWVFPGGLETYWYANATRFIPYAIHEFPSYSFVVSDVHGHVLSLPFVLLAIGLLITMFLYKSNWFSYIFYGFLVGVLLMTNALDGPIYFGLFIVVFFMTNRSNMMHKAHVVLGVFTAALITSLPFLSHFSSFVNGLAVNCPPRFLANTHIGPLLFEGVEKCQRSPIWMMWVLWGFFWYCGIGFILSKIGHIRQISRIRLIWQTKFTHIDKLLAVFFIISVLLVIFPEFFYFKDIYPMHFRSNTMFKLGYQAFILFSIVSAYAIVSLKNKIFFLLLIPQLFLVSIYPIFSVRSYFGQLQQYEGIFGLNWLIREYPDDFMGIQWLQKQTPSNLVEADGDSYTDYARFSVFTGMPTPIGWAVHEWLWRGSYDVVSPRREDVRKIYEISDIQETKALLDQYHVRYIIVGTIERQKYPKLVEDKFVLLGTEVFHSGNTVIYDRDNALVDKQ